MKIKELISEESNTPSTEEIKEQFKKTYYKMHTPWIKDIVPNRNDICPCGSGKKYKKCCGKNSKSSYSNIDI